MYVAVRRAAREPAPLDRAHEDRESRPFVGGSPRGPPAGDAGAWRNSWLSGGRAAVSLLAGAGYEKMPREP